MKKSRVIQRSTQSGDHSNIAVISEDSDWIDERPEIIVDSEGVHTVTWISPSHLRKEMQDMASMEEQQTFLDKVISKMLLPPPGIKERIDPELLNKIIRRALLIMVLT